MAEILPARVDLAQCRRAKFLGNALLFTTIHGPAVGLLALTAAAEGVSDDTNGAGAGGHTAAARDLAEWCPWRPVQDLARGVVASLVPADRSAACRSGLVAGGTDHSGPRGGGRYGNPRHARANGGRERQRRNAVPRGDRQPDRRHGSGGPGRRRPTGYQRPETDRGGGKRTSGGRRAGPGRGGAGGSADEAASGTDVARGARAAVAGASHADRCAKDVRSDGRTGRAFV